MQGSVFNQGAGPGAFNSAFGSNVPHQGFNAAFNQAFGGSTPAFGRSDTSNHNSPFNRAIGQSAFGVKSSAEPKKYVDSSFDNAISGAFGSTPKANQHVSPFTQPTHAQYTSPFGQPVSTPLNPFGSPANGSPNQHISPFGQANNNVVSNNHTSPFIQPNTSVAQHASPFNPPTTPVQHASPFKQSNASAQHKSPFKQSDAPVNHTSPFNQPNASTTHTTPFKQSDASTAYVSPFKRLNSPGNTKAPFKQTKSVSSFDQTPKHSNSPATVSDGVKKQAEINPQSKRIRGKGKSIDTPTVLKKSVKPNLASVSPFGKKNPRISALKEKATVTKEASKTTAEDRAMRFGSTSKSILYDQFKERRVRERQQAIENGLIPDPNNPTRLEDAIDFRGTCQTKCPEFEMLERDIQNGLDSLEMDAEGNVDPEKAVKAYRRSAAGIDQPLPSDVRSPEALLSTLDYLVDEILSKNSLDKCHAFVRDRTRSIRQDFTLQNIRDINAVQAHERIARFHILCLHEMCEMDEGKFSKQQETEQLRKVLVSLMEFYDDLREEGIETENEAEFRAYNIISLIRDQDVARQAMTLPVYLFKSQPITRALEFRALSQRNNEIMESSSRRNKPENIEASQNFYSAFFKLVADSGTSFLMACMLETHFSEIRKGALKAMNVSYMIKAGGVQAEDVRQVLAYDSVKQLFQEAALYGIIIDNSLGEPTLCFGQKHYQTKIAVFLEPLSNPPQTKSLLLVEPKKAGCSFSDIINGMNLKSTRIINNRVFARQPNPFSNEKPSIQPEPIVLNCTLSELTGPNDLKKEHEQQLETARIKAEVATAQAARERKKLEALQEKKRIETELKQERQREAERIKKEQQIREELQMKEERIKQMEREREEAMQRHQVMQRQQREKQIAEMHLNVVKSQLSKRFLDQILTQVIEEEAKVATIKAIRCRNTLKRIALPWLGRAKQTLLKRRENALERKRKWNFNMFIVTHNPYVPSNDTIYMVKPMHSTIEGIKERVHQSLLAEKVTLESIDTTANQVSIWEHEDFTKQVYPRIRDKMLSLKHSRHNKNNSTKPAWQLNINVSNCDLQSSKWFKEKFDLDNISLRKDGLYQCFDVIIRMTTPEKEIACQFAEETGAIIFSLPESSPVKTPAEVSLYWEDNKKRLNKLVDDMNRYNPGIKIPFLFTYFPDSSSTEVTLQKLPILLGLDSNRLVSDYHILIMNPATIGSRLAEEVNWLSNNTIIHQE